MDRPVYCSDCFRTVSPTDPAPVERDAGYLDAAGAPTLRRGRPTPRPAGAADHLGVAGHVGLARPRLAPIPAVRPPRRAPPATVEAADAADGPSPRAPVVVDRQRSAARLACAPPDRDARARRGPATTPSRSRRPRSPRRSRARRPARRLQATSATAARATRRSGARPSPGRTQPGPPAQRPGASRRRGSRTRGRRGPSPRPSNRPARRPARARRERPPDGAPVEDAQQVPRLAARQVDQVGLADRLRRARVVGVRAVADQHRLDLRAEPAEMRRAHRRPAVEDLLAVGLGGGRQDHDPRPGAPGGREQLAVEVGHRGQELTGAYERHGSGHGESLPRRAPVRRPVPLRHCPRMTQTPAMDPRRRDHRLGGRVPRRDDRERRPQAHRQSCRRRSSASLEGQAYIVSGYLAVAGRAPHPRRRPGRPLRPPPDLRDRPRRFGVDLRAVRPRADARVLVVVPPAPGRGRRAAGPGLAVAHHRTRSRAPQRARAFGMWAAATSGADARSAPSSAGRSSTPSAGACAFLINVPLVAIALWATIRHVEESRDTEATGRFDWLGALVAALAVGGLAFGLIRGQADDWARPARVGRDRRRRASALDRRSRSSWRAGRTRSCRSALFRIRAFAVINLSTFLIYGALYVNFCYLAVVLQGVARLHGAGGRRCSASPTGVMLALALDAGRHARRADRRPAVPRGRAAPHGRRRCSGARGSRPTRRRGMASSTTSSTLIPPVDVAHRRPAGRRSCSGSGSRCVVAPLTSTLMGSIPTRNAGPRVGDQQRDLAGRPAAARRGHLHRDQRDVLRDPRDAGAVARHVVARGPGGLPAAQPAAGPAPRPSRSAPRPRRRSTPSTLRCSPRRSCS